MPTFTLFWPSLRAARSVDPLQDPILPPIDGSASGGEAWYWTEQFIRGGNVPADLTVDEALVALGEHAHEPSEQADGERIDDHDPSILARHVELAYSLDRRDIPVEDGRRNRPPADLDGVLAYVARYAPGNIAYRCIGRLIGPDHQLTAGEHWVAAAKLSMAIRSMFNRPESSLLFDRILPGTVSWRAVLTYTRWGNLEAVIDEYLHHLAGPQRSTALDAAAVMQIVAAATTAIATRPSQYEAFDPSRPSERIKFPSRLALRYGSKQGTIQGGQAEHRATDIRAAFNSPFWPFLLSTTSVGQEGIDFHWWCRAVVHWNSPASPVDFEQREGRVNRYGGLAVRQNIGMAFRDRILEMSRSGAHPWDAAYVVAAEELAVSGQTDADGLKPHWVTTGDAKIERHLFHYPLSRDEPRYARLKDDVALYRLTFGQPRQEDLIDLLRQRGLHDDLGAIESMRLDLSPPVSMSQPSGE